jgi:hypothetical protein
VRTCLSEGMSRRKSAACYRPARAENRLHCSKGGSVIVKHAEFERAAAAEALYVRSGVLEISQEGASGRGNEGKNCSI